MHGAGAPMLWELLRTFTELWIRVGAESPRMKVFPGPNDPFEPDWELLTAWEFDWLTLPMMTVEAAAVDAPKPTVAIDMTKRLRSNK